MVLGWEIICTVSDDTNISARPSQEELLTNSISKSVIITWINPKYMTSSSETSSALMFLFALPVVNSLVGSV